MSFESRSWRRAVLAANAIAPVGRNRLLTVPSFFASWLTTETAGPLLAADLLDTVGFVAKGGMKSRRGAAAITTRIATSAVLIHLLREARTVDDEFQHALLGYRDIAQLDSRPRSDHRGAVLPVFTGGKGRVRHRDIAYADTPRRQLSLDVYEPADPAAFAGPRPIVVYVHGGAWVLGDKREQGIPLLNHLASNGWVCFSVNYRLSPKVKAPDHLIDVKRALAWIKDHAAEYNADPEFVSVIGNSAGGHLCALMALTANRPEFQPGFEDSDTAIQAAVPFYGVFDMVDRDGFNGGPEFRMMLERTVFAKSYETDPDAFHAYSPLDQVHGDAPPMLVVHGSKDVLVPVEGARQFVERMREVSKNPVLYAELTGAQHAFDVFPSPRTVRTVEWVEQFLTETWERHQASAAARLDAQTPMVATAS